METNLEELAEKAEAWIKVNRRALFIGGSLVLSVWILSLIKEVTLLLLVSYLVAVLINPAVTRLTNRLVGRGGATIILLVLAIFTFALILFVLLPPVIAQYAELITLLPDYAERLVRKLSTLATDYGMGKGANFDTLIAWIKVKATTLGPDSLRNAGAGLLSFLLQGYSLTLTILNLTLLPFFVFYLSDELERIHSFIGDFLPEDLTAKYASVANSILTQIYGFFKAQITVSILMAVLYSIGLSIFGVPSGMAIGLLAGLLNIVPYLGVIVGVILSLSATLISNPAWSSVLSVLGVFVTVQIIEAFILTPKIVGDKTGIHPLGIILSLLIGGQLLGILGLIVAIPAAAAIKILFLFVWEEVKQSRNKLIIPHSSIENTSA